MSEVLAVAVGGSIEPIILAVKSRRPRFTLFFVTAEPRGGSQATLPRILKEAEVADRTYRATVVIHPDDFASCYQTMRDAMRHVQEEFKEGQFVADYTGGTKTMTAALVAAALRLGWNLSLVVSPRDDLNRAHLAGVPTPQSTALVVLDELRDRVQILYEAGYYDGAKDLLTAAMKDLPLEPGTRSALVRAVNLLTGLALWDRFEYGEAYKHLRACGEVCGEVLPLLARLKECPEEAPSHDLVADLVGNAHSRAKQGRYEDAVLRLYRAVELLAQVRLGQAHQLKTDDLELGRIPPGLREELVARAAGAKKVTAGLRDAYRILAELGDPLGEVFTSWEPRLRDLMELRNKAFMEHGFKPLDETKWRRASELAEGFLAEGFKALKLTWQVTTPPPWEAVEALFRP